MSTWRNCRYKMTTYIKGSGQNGIRDVCFQGLSKGMHKSTVDIPSQRSRDGIQLNRSVEDYR